MTAGAERSFLDPVAESLDDIEVHIGFEQREADLAQYFVDVFFFEDTLAAEATKDAVKSI